MILQDILIFSGAFLGCLLAMFLDYKKAVKDISGWIFSVILSFAVFGVYEALVSLAYMPAVMSGISLFGISLFIGFSIKALTRKFWEIINKG